MNVRARIRAWSDPWGYVAIYLGWAWAFWTVVIASGESVWTFPNVVLFYIGSISPALAGVVMVARTAGRSGLRELWDRIRSPRRIRLRWYAVIVLLYPTLTVLAALIVRIVGASDTPLLDPAGTVERLTTPLSLVAFLGFTLGAGLVEETGSTGFFLDRLMKHYVPGMAGLISGVVWASWHIPLFFMNDYYGQASFEPIPWRFFATFVFLEIIYAWIYDNTRRSVQAAVLFHLMINLTGEVLAPSQPVRWATFALTILTALALVAWERRRSRAGTPRDQDARFVSDRPPPRPRTPSDRA